MAPLDNQEQRRLSKSAMSRNPTVNQPWQLGPHQTIACAARTSTRTCSVSSAFSATNSGEVLIE